MNHDLKITPAYFQAVIEGRKTFEIRQNDRGYQAGDTVTLQEWDDNMPRPSDWPPMRDQRWKFTRRSVVREVGYVTGFEQRPNWVVFSLLRIEGQN